MDLILASASPRRRELLERVGYSVSVEPSDVDESVEPKEAAVDYVRRIAMRKAQRELSRGQWLVAADTTVHAGADILGKPFDDADARGMLEKLRSAEHSVTTAFVVRSREAQELRHVTTRVVMRPFSDQELESYVACGEWRGKAGGYAVQGIAAALVREVRGSITNVVGLPIAEVIEVLADMGGPAPAFRRGVPA